MADVNKIRAQNSAPYSNKIAFSPGLPSGVINPNINKVVNVNSGGYDSSFLLQGIVPTLVQLSGA